MPESLPAMPGLWLYVQGETGYVSLAFDAWVREQPDGWWFSLHRALSVFRYDQRGRELVSEFGMRTPAENHAVIRGAGWFDVYDRATALWLGRKQ